MTQPGLLDSARFLLASYRPALVRMMLILGAILGAVWMGRTIANGSIDIAMLLAATAAPLFLLILLRLGRYEYGFLAVVFTAGMVNIVTLPTGTDSRIVISLLVCAALVGIWVLDMLVVKKRLSLKPTPINRPLLLFVAANFVAYGWSILLRDPNLLIWKSFPVVQLAALAVNALLPLAALLVANQIDDIKWLKRLTGLMLGMGIFVVASLLFNLPTDPLWYNGASGLFAMWVTALAFALALFDEELPAWLRGLLLLLVAAWILRNFVLARIWLSGWAPMFAACLVITMLRSRKLLALTVAAGLVFVAANFDSLYNEIIVANQEEGGDQRLELWQISLSHVANHPLFGMGPAGYAIYNMTYNPQDARSTHNNYFDVLAQTGVVGFAIFVWLLASLLLVGIRTRRAVRGRHNFEDAFSAGVLGGLVAAVVAMMLGDWVIPFAYNSTIQGFDHSVYTWIFAGGLVSLSLILQRDASPDAVPAPPRPPQ